MFKLIETELLVATNLYQMSLLVALPQLAPVTTGFKAGEDAVAPKVFPKTLFNMLHSWPVLTVTLVALIQLSFYGGDVMQISKVADCAVMLLVV